MPLHYNLTQVYSLSNKKIEIIQAMVASFVSESEVAILKIGKSVKKKKYHKVLKHSNSIIASTELFGLDTAHENLLRIIEWAKSEGKKKEIRATCKEFNKQMKSAIKELQKDYSIKTYLKEL